MLRKPVATSSSALTNFIQIVKEPTHLSGSLIDHVYIHQELLGNANAEVKNFDVYFSDHHVCQISLTDKSNNWISNTLHFLNFHFSKNVFLLSNFVWHYFLSGADVIDTVRFSKYCLVTKFVNAEAAKTFKHLSVMNFFLSYSSINFCKMFSFLLIFQHISQ